MATAACEACGWIAAAISMLAFGSFGAPIKSNASRSVNVDPLVFQTYKSFLCLVTAPIVLLLGQPFTFTPWGIVSGLFWVPGGIATVYAVKAAGLAVAIGVSSSFIVLVSFVWGIFIMNESVRSRIGASIAVCLMMLGLSGMAYFSSPAKEANTDLAQQFQIVEGIDEAESDSSSGSIKSDSSVTRRRVDGYQGVQVRDDGERRSAEAGDNPVEIGYGSHRSFPYTPERTVHICGLKVSRRVTGIAAAVFNGVWGGSIMVPMKWSPGNTNGMGYLISFAVGAWTITLVLWLFRYLFLVVQSKSLQRAYDRLPSLHVRVMWLAGGTSGTLWSIGNLFSMIAVQHLGEGVGYSVCQAAMLVSGLWGIFYFHEVKGTERILKWFASACLTVCGILMLSYEHHTGAAA